MVACLQWAIKTGKQKTISGTVIWSPEATYRGRKNSHENKGESWASGECKLHVWDSKPWVGTYCMLGDLMMVATGSETELPSQPAAVCSSRTVCQELSCGRHSPTIPGAKIWFETKWKRAKQLVDIPMFLSYIAITLVIRDKGTWAHTVYLKQVRCCSRN